MLEKSNRVKSLAELIDLLKDRANMRFNDNFAQVLAENFVTESMVLKNCGALTNAVRSPYWDCYHAELAASFNFNITRPIGYRMFKYLLFDMSHEQFTQKVTVRIRKQKAAAAAENAAKEHDYTADAITYDGLFSIVQNSFVLGKRKIKEDFEKGIEKIIQEKNRLIKRREAQERDHDQKFQPVSNFVQPLDTEITEQCWNLYVRTLPAGTPIPPKTNEHLEIVRREKETEILRRARLRYVSTPAAQKQLTDRSLELLKTFRDNLKDKQADKIVQELEAVGAEVPPILKKSFELFESGEDLLDDELRREANRGGNEGGGPQGN